MILDEAASARSGRSRYNRMMRILRRIHMYLGLFMLPFVLIYGVSGFLFNHGQVLAPYDIRRLGSEPGQRILETLPQPAALADTILQRLTEELPDRTFSMTDPADARYTVTMGFRTHEGDVRHHLVFEAENWTAEIHSATPKPKVKTPLGDLKKLNIGSALRDSVIKVAESIYQTHDQPTGRVDHQWGPQLRFDVESNEESWTMFYNLGNRAIWAHSATGTEGRNTGRDYLLGLHLAHTYPIHPNVRTAWAVMVDLMSVTMILWAITGGAMWWQMRNVRRSGTILLIISLIWTIGLSYLMYFAFKTPG